MFVQVKVGSVTLTINWVRLALNLRVFWFTITFHWSRVSKSRLLVTGARSFHVKTALCTLKYALYAWGSLRWCIAHALTYAVWCVQCTGALTYAVWCVQCTGALTYAVWCVQCTGALTYAVWCVQCTGALTYAVWCVQCTGALTYAVWCVQCTGSAFMKGCHSGWIKMVCVFWLYNRW